MITYSPPTTTETTSDYSAFGDPTADATNNIRRQLPSSSSEASTEPETITFTLDSPKVMSSFGILIPEEATSFTLSSNIFEDIEATPGVMAIVDVQSSLQYLEFDYIEFSYAGTAELQISKILVFESETNTGCYFNVLDDY